MQELGPSLAEEEDEGKEKVIYNRRDFTENRRKGVSCRVALVLYSRIKPKLEKNVGGNQKNSLAGSISGRLFAQGTNTGSHRGCNYKKGTRGKGRWKKRRGCFALGQGPCSVSSKESSQILKAHWGRFKSRGGNRHVQTRRQNKRRIKSVFRILEQLFWLSNLVTQVGGSGKISARRGAAGGSMEGRGSSLGALTLSYRQSPHHFRRTARNSGGRGGGGKSQFKGGENPCPRRLVAIFASPRDRNLANGTGRGVKEKEGGNGKQGRMARGKT